MAGIDWQQHFSSAFAEGRLIQLVVSRPLVPGIESKATARPIEAGGRTLYQWTIQRGSQEFHENLTAEACQERIHAYHGSQYGDLHWFANDGDYTVRYKGRGQSQVKRKPPTKRLESPRHNRTRKYLIPDDRPCAFLQEIGVMLPDGRVKPSMFHKFRQINRYLEFVHDIYDELPSEGVLRVVDFGCGKSYLTFAVHHYLTQYKRRKVDIIGLDRKADVVEHCRQIARKLECAGLDFQPGDIRTYTPTTDVHLAISLHACDTATDDAIASALRWQSRVIFAVPCCQHEISQLLPDTTLPGLLGYGLAKERFASLATDALRARYLETRGYRTQVMEFIETEHTPKNILLRAIRRTYTAAELSERERDYQQLKQDLGITGWHLDPA